MAIQWSHNVRYEPDYHLVVFERNGEERSQAERMMEYLEELYPEKPWIEIAKIAVPELNQLNDISMVRFFSL